MLEEIEVNGDIEFGREGMLNRLKKKGEHRLSWLQERKYWQERRIEHLKREIKDSEEEILAINEGIAANS